jgi:hypothetical protein
MLGEVHKSQTSSSNSLRYGQNPWDALAPAIIIICPWLCRLLCRGLSSTTKVEELILHIAVHQMLCDYTILMTRCWCTMKHSSQ